MRTVHLPSPNDTEGPRPQGHQRERLRACAACGIPSPAHEDEDVHFCERCLDHAALDEYSGEWDDLGGEG
ncbi:MAG: hypothetical protein EP330_16395 [Deltaproteobacteria bacterium]|nr:MAG: hypothetical protein EP330_16395 [Deltaproteobacteria bacterium]